MTLSIVTIGNQKVVNNAIFNNSTVLDFAKKALTKWDLRGKISPPKSGGQVPARDVVAFE